MLFVVTWFWGSKFTLEDVRKLRDGVARHMAQDYRFVLAKPHPEDEYLTLIPGCFCRLRLFDPGWQRWMGIEHGDRILNLDLDTVITGSLDALADRPEPFVILQGGNRGNPCPYGGAVMLLRVGAHAEVWNDFTLDKATRPPVQKHDFYDDQGWIWHMIPDAAAFPCGVQSGVYVFAKTGWPRDNKLPPGARMVTFSSGRSPDKFKHLDWIKRNWS